MKRTFILLLPLMLCGCMHTVKYKLTETERWHGPKIDGVLLVQSITDETTYGIEDWKPQRMDGKVWRTNSRGSYNHSNLTAEVTAMVARHLAHSGIFSKVLTGKANDADYVLTGKLTEFKTLAEVNSKAEGIQMGAAGFGLVGAVVAVAATQDMKSQVKTTVTLASLQVSDKSGQMRWQDSITIAKDELRPFRESEKALLYCHTDQALKIAVSELIQRLANAGFTNSTSIAR